MIVSYVLGPSMLLRHFAQPTAEARLPSSDVFVVARPAESAQQIGRACRFFPALAEVD